MNILTITLIILATAGALILGMAALIKTMILGVLEQIQSQLGGVVRDVHRVDVRVTRIEATLKLPPYPEEAV